MSAQLTIPARPTLTAIPTELRLQIYEHVIELHKQSNASSRGHWSINAVLVLNKQLSAEALPICYANLEHRIKHFDVPLHATAHLHKAFIFLDADLLWENFDRFETCLSLLARWCGKLDTIRIHIEAGQERDFRFLRNLLADVSQHAAAICGLRGIILESRASESADLASARLAKTAAVLRGTIARRPELGAREAGLKVRNVQREV